MPRLVLASRSPRRRALLGGLGIPFDVRPGDVDETLPGHLDLPDALKAVAGRKALAVRAALAEPDAAVLAADTAVVVGDRVFGKPRDRAEARAMLEALSGRAHRVITAVALEGPAVQAARAVETRVVFRPLGAAEIEWYTGLDEPYDKAGGYAIQGRGAFLVAEIQGSYTNVVGLPMSETVDLLAGAGLAPWQGGTPRGEARRAL